MGQSIAADAAGNIYVTGYTLSADFPTTRDALQSIWGRGTDSFLTKLNPSLSPSMVYSSYLGSIGIHVGNAVAAARDGSICMGGVTGMRNISATEGAIQNNYAGGLSDGFVLLLAP